MGVNGLVARCHWALNFLEIEIKLIWIDGNTFVLRGTAQDNGSGVDEVEVKAGALLWDTADGTTEWEYEWTVSTEVMWQ